MDTIPPKVLSTTAHLVSSPKYHFNSLSQRKSLTRPERCFWLNIHQRWTLSLIPYDTPKQVYADLSCSALRKLAGGTTGLHTHQKPAQSVTKRTSSCSTGPNPIDRWSEPGFSASIERLDFLNCSRWGRLDNSRKFGYYQRGDREGVCCELLWRVERDTVLFICSHSPEMGFEPLLFHLPCSLMMAFIGVSNIETQEQSPVSQSRPGWDVRSVFLKAFLGNSHVLWKLRYTRLNEAMCSEISILFWHRGSFVDRMPQGVEGLTGLGGPQADTQHLPPPPQTQNFGTCPGGLKAFS